MARAEASDDGNEGTIQIDGTLRSNCGTGLQEPVSVTTVEHSLAVAVRADAAVGRCGSGDHRAGANAPKISRVCQFSWDPSFVFLPTPRR